MESGDPTAPGRTGSRLTATWTIVLAMVSGGVGLVWFAMHSERPATARPEAAAATPTPTPTPTAVAVVPPTKRGPFADTPAYTWANDEAGIQLPAPRKIGGWSKKDVGLALLGSRELLVTANLDPRVVLRGHPKPYLRLIAPSDRDRIARAIAKPSKKATATAYISRFGRGTLFEGSVVKVKGLTTVRLGKAGTLEVSHNYKFAYPVKRRGSASAERTVVVVHRKLTHRFYPRHQLRPEDRAFPWLGPSRMWIWGTGCEDRDDGWLRPDYGATTAPPSLSPDESDKKWTFEEPKYDCKGEQVKPA